MIAAAWPAGKALARNRLLCYTNGILPLAGLGQPPGCIVLKFGSHAMNPANRVRSGTKQH